MLLSLIENAFLSSTLFIWRRFNESRPFSRISFRLRFGYDLRCSDELRFGSSAQ